MEVPHHLKFDFIVLEDICFQMKKTHPNMKRSVKFDDDRLGLMVDVNLVRDDWKRIRPDQARAVKRDEPSLRTEPAEFSRDVIMGAIRGQPNDSLGSGTGANAVPIGPGGSDAS